MEDGAEVHLLGGQQRKAPGEVEAHLTAADGERAGAGTVGLGDAVVQNVPEQVEVGPHGGENLAWGEYPILTASGLERSSCRRPSLLDPLEPHCYDPRNSQRNTMRIELTEEKSLLQEPV